MIQRPHKLRIAPGGRLSSLGQDYDRGHREYVAKLTPGDALWLRTKPFAAPPNFELATCLRTFSHIVEQLELGLRAQVLDVGCGPGWLSELLTRCGYWVTGVDISEDMIRIARERIDAIGGLVGEGIDPQAEFHATHVRDMQWENRFEAAVLFDTMHHFDDEIETLRVILRALAPGGRLYIREGVRPLPGSVDERNLVAEMEAYGTLESPFDPDYLRWSVEEAGFVDVKQFVEVDELLPLDDVSRPLALLGRWARIRLGRRRPETNTLLARKPLAGLDPSEPFRGQIAAGDPPWTDADGVIHVPLRVENTGVAFWPAATSFANTQGIVNVGPYLLEDGRRIELPRGELPRSMAAQESAELELRVPRDVLGGRDDVLVDLVRERIAWFSAPDAPIARVRIDDA